VIEKVVKKQKVTEYHAMVISERLAFWLSRQEEERISTVEFLRKQYHGNTARLQRVVRVIQRSQR
jgi:hypothetical protein